MGFIYKITNDINNKVYVGKTLHSTIEERFKEHCADSTRKRMEQRPLYAAMRKYGTEHFRISLIGEYPNEQLSEMEIYWIAYYKGYEDGYNATKGGDGSILYDHQAIISRLKEYPYPTKVANEFNCGVDLVYELVKQENIQIKTSQEQARERFSKRVVQLDKDTLEELCEFNSLHEAGVNYLTHINQEIDEDKIRGIMTHIREVANGKRHTAYGYKWKFVNDIDKS